MLLGIFEFTKSYAVSKIKDEFTGYGLHDKVYKLAAVSLWVYFCLGAITVLILGHEYLNSLAQIFIYVFAFTCTVGVVIEYSSTIKALLSQTWFKWLLGGISIFVFKYSEAQSDDFINNFTGIDPSFLPFSSSVLATLYLLYSWLVTVSAFLSVYVIFMWIFIPFEKSNSQRKLGGWKYIARFTGLIVIFFTAENAIRFLDSPDSIPSEIAKHVVISTEYFKKSHCVNVLNNELSADIGRGYISIFNQDNSKFRTDVCQLHVSNQ